MALQLSLLPADLDSICHWQTWIEGAGSSRSSACYCAHCFNIMGWFGHSCVWCLLPNCTQRGGTFTAQCGEAGMETVLVISSVGYRRQGCILLSQISDCFTQDSADDLLNWRNTRKQYVEYVANTFFDLFTVCTCFFGKVRSGPIRSQVSTATAWAPWILYQFPAGEKSSLLVIFRLFTLQGTAWTSGQTGP